MANPLANLDVVRLAKKYPLPAAAAVGGVGLLAFVATRGGGAYGSVPETDTPGDVTDPTAIPDPELFGTDPAAGSPFAGPPGAGYYDPFGSGGPDPFGGSTDPGTPPVTADGCSWPPPTIPAGYEGKGSWSCDAGAWTWVWITAPPGGDTSPGGCPLPRPTVPTALVGSYKYQCHGGAWRLVPIGTPTPDPDPKPKPKPKPDPHHKPNVSKGQHVTWAGHRNARNKLILSDRRQFTLQLAAHFNLGPAQQGDATPGKPHGTHTVRRIIAAPGHAGLVGRWLKV